MRIQSVPPIEVHDATGEPDNAASLYGIVNGKQAESVTVLGRRTVFNSAAVFQDVATYLVGGQNALNAVLATTTYFVVSDSATDVAGSAGVSKVRIVALDGGGAPVTITATLNGTTKVSIGSGFSAFQWMESAEMGTAAAIAAVGNIAIFSGAGAAAAESTTVEQILAGGNKSLSGRYTIPTAFSGYLHQMNCGSPGSQSMDIRLRATVFADDRTLSPNIFHYQAIAFLAATSAPYAQVLPMLACPAGTQIKFSVIPAATTGTPRCDVGLVLVLIAD